MNDVDRHGEISMVNPYREKFYGVLKEIQSNILVTNDTLDYRREMSTWLNPEWKIE